MSNIKGHYFSKRHQKYITCIMIDGKRKQLGSFNTPKEASECYINNKLN